jgi:phosphate transport system permease protein
VSRPQAPAGAPQLRAGAHLRRRRRWAAAFHALTVAMTLTGVAFLLLLLFQVVRDAWGWLDWQFLTSFPSRRPADAGIKSALFGTLWMIAFTAAMAIPVGVAAAVYLEEYARPSRIKTFIQINIANLAGVPSIVYGILGLAMFVRFLGLGRSVLAGAMTMALLILPVIIIAAREAIRAVPPSLRQAAYALGATRWQTVRHHVLPVALPGILTGVILALSRAIGEAAPLIMIGGLAFVAFVPEGPLDQFTALPIQIFNWASRPQGDFHHVAAAGILVLLGVLFAMNSVAIVLRQRSGRSR